MLRMLLAAAAAFALAASQPVFACDCKDCPHHASAAEKADKKDKAAPCDCAKECKCAPNCTCTHCKEKTAPEKKEGKDQKKT